MQLHRDLGKVVVKNRQTHLYTSMHTIQINHAVFFNYLQDEPPKIADYPKSLKDALLDEPVTFTIQATGTEPLDYHWEHKSRDGSQGWQSCDVESFPGANSSTLTIPSVQKSR